MPRAKLERTRTPGVYKRGDRYTITYRDQDGRQRWESARTYDDARKLKAKRTQEVERGEWHQQSRVRFAEYAREWVERYQGRGRGFREDTRDDYRRDLERYAIPFLDARLKRTVSQVTPRDIANFVGWLCDDEAQRLRHKAEVAARQRENQLRAERNAELEAGVTPEPTLPALGPPSIPLADATVRRLLAPVRSCLSTAVREGLIRSNPCADVALPARDAQRRIDDDQDDEREVKIPSRDQLRALLGIAVQPEHRLLLRVLAGTHLRSHRTEVARRPPGRLHAARQDPAAPRQRTLRPSKEQSRPPRRTDQPRAGDRLPATPRAHGVAASRRHRPMFIGGDTTTPREPSPSTSAACRRSRPPLARLPRPAALLRQRPDRRWAQHRAGQPPARPPQSGVHAHRLRASHGREHRRAA